MAGAEPRATAAELAVLQVLWNVGEATIREIASAVYGEPNSTNYATVQKLLERLTAKGCTVRDVEASPQRFRAVVAKEKLIRQELLDVAERLCEGSFAPLLTHLAENVKLSKSERDALRRMLDEPPPPKKGAKR